jgi:hypothetical protein
LLPSQREDLNVLDLIKDDKIVAALVAAVASVAVCVIGYWVQRAKFRQEFRDDVAQIRTGFMAEAAARQLLQQFERPFRTFVMIRHHIGGFTDDELRRILVRAGAIRFMSQSGMELWALYDRIRHYKASWDDQPRNYLSVWKLPADPSAPSAEELFPCRLTAGIIQEGAAGDRPSVGSNVQKSCRLCEKSA